MKLHHLVFTACLAMTSLVCQAQEGAAAPAPAEPDTAPAPALAPEPAAAPAPMPAAEPAPTPMARGSVARAAFTTGIKDHEPIDELKSLSNDVHTVYYFTDLHGMTGQTATHRWEYNGKVIAEVHFKVGGPRWRVWSSKTLLPEWLGQWKVSVLNGAGQLISEDALDYTAAPKPAAMPEQPVSAPAEPAPAATETAPASSVSPASGPSH